MYSDHSVSVQTMKETTNPPTDPSAPSAAHINPPASNAAAATTGREAEENDDDMPDVEWMEMYYTSLSSLFEFDIPSEANIFGVSHTDEMLTFISLLCFNLLFYSATRSL